MGTYPTTVFETFWEALNNASSHLLEGLDIVQESFLILRGNLRVLAGFNFVACLTSKIF